MNSDRQASSRDESHSGSEEDKAPQDEQRQAVEAAAEAAAAAGLTPYMHNGQVRFVSSARDGGAGLLIWCVTANRELKQATFLTLGRQPEWSLFPI